MAIQSMSLQEALEGGYEIVGPDPIERTAPPTLTESAISIGLDIIPPIVGSIVGGIKGGPAGAYGGGAAGGALGNFLSQNYRISQGLKDDFGTAELATSTVLSGLPLGKLANTGMAAKTAIRAGQGSALATADLAARAYIDEDRAPTQEELASTILFGGVLGGALGAAEAKWFSDTTGVSVKEAQTRDELLDTLTLSVKEAGGPRQFDATQKTGYFTFRDPRGNFVFNDPVVDELTTTSGLATNNALGPRRLNRLDQAELPGPRALPGPQQKQLTNRTGRPGDDAVVVEAEVLDAMSPREYAEGLLSGIESKLLLETTEQVRNLAKTADTTPEIQSLKNLFEQKIASDSEIFTGVNPVIAKGEAAKLNLPATKRLREIDKELDEMHSDLSREPFFVIDTSLRKLNRKDLERLRLSKLKESRQLDSRIKTSSDEIKFGRKLDKVDKELQSIELEQWRRRQEDNVEFYLKHKNKGDVTIQGLTLTPDERKSDLVNDILENLRIDAGDSEVKVAIALDTLKKHNLEGLLEDGLRNKRFFYGTQVEKSDADFLLNTDIKSLVNIHAKYFGKKPANNSSRPKLIAEKRSLEKKHGINSRSFLPLPKDGPFTMDNILPAAVGMAAITDIMTDEDEDNIAQAGGWGLALAAVAKIAGVKMSKASRRIKEGALKGQAQNAKDDAIRAKGGTPKKPAEPKGKQADRTNIANYQKDELFEMIQDANQPSIIKEQAIAVLAERASRNTASGQRLRRELEEFGKTGRATNTKIRVDDMPTQLTTQRGIQSAASVPISQGLQARSGKQLVQEAIEGNEFSLQELRRRAAKNPRTKKLMDKNDLITGLLTTGAGASGVISLMLDEEDDTVSKAMMGGGELLVALALATLGYKGSKKFFKSPQGKKLQAQTRKNPEAAEPVDIKMQSVKNTNERNAFIPPGKVKKAWRDFSGIVSDALDPLSRKLKKISPAIVQTVREHDKAVSKKTAEFINRGSPFLVSMGKLLKDKTELQERLHNHLLNGEYNEIASNILDKVNAPTAVYKEMKQMRDVLNEVREYARERGGIDVGYIEDYFPRIVADYKSFREALGRTRNVEVKNQIDTALEEYAKKNNIGAVEQIPESEAAEVVSRVLRGYPQQQGMTPGSAKMRKIQEVDGQMAAGYKKPGEAFTEYIERMVQATERRNFFYRKAKSASTVGFQGSKDRLGADLGSKMEVADGISSVVMRLQKENNLSSDDVEILQRLIEGRFSSKSVGSFVGGYKNINYIATMGNFGSAITQLGDLAYSFHFNGFDNTFQSMFNKKIDFVKMFGLTNVNTDLINSSGITAKALDNVFTVTGLKKLDQFAKNTTMNAIWRKQKQLAAKDANALLDDLRPTFGDDLSRQMVRELQSSNPNSQNLPKAVEELIWYKFLDLNPATLTEMPFYYNSQGNWRILYMLKSFTLKQFDVFRQAGIDDIQKAKTLYSQGKKEQAANLATKGVGNLLKLGMVFAAANATTDVIKDTMYGRPTKPDDLVVNNLLKLVGVNRYMAYEFQRKGLGSVVGQTILPPFTLIDRLSRDLSAIHGDGPVKGNLLQGTPLDLYYWHYLGGLDKVERMK
jgi:hypothetical protein